MASFAKVCPVTPLTKDKFQQKLSVAWSRLWHKHGNKVRIAETMGLTDTAPLDRGLTGANLPGAHVIFNSLLVDPTALDEILAHYGVRAVPLAASPANDLATATGVMDAMVALVRALEDNHRDHQETLDVADRIQPHLAALAAIVNEAAVLRGAA
ncbi:hypothetical protein ABIC65_001061 [Sphingomonas trueperi]|uniref:hypothetical protein n=1 Tax=Sphingomonas trueperi TaxID=53317 RepID=UPI0033989D01